MAISDESSAPPDVGAILKTGGVALLLFCLVISAALNAYFILQKASLTRDLAASQVAARKANQVSGMLQGLADDVAVLRSTDKDFEKLAQKYSLVNVRPGQSR